MSQTIKMYQIIKIERASTSFHGIFDSKQKAIDAIEKYISQEFEECDIKYVEFGDLWYIEPPEFECDLEDFETQDEIDEYIREQIKYKNLGSIQICEIELNHFY